MRYQTSAQSLIYLKHHGKKCVPAVLPFFYSNKRIRIHAVERFNNLCEVCWALSSFFFHFPCPFPSLTEFELI